LLVGLTGGIGSGKSTVAKIFKSFDIPVFNSDNEAKNIINNDKEVIRLITNGFGSIYEKGKLNTQKMADLVFKDETALKNLNNIIHPRVKESFKEWVLENTNAKILIKEAAILIEAGAYKELDKVILVTAPEKIRIKRVVKRDTISEEKVVARMKSQFSDEEKLNYANFNIVNDGKQLVIPQVIKTYNQLKSLND